METAAALREGRLQDVDLEATADCMFHRTRSFLGTLIFFAATAMGQDNIDSNAHCIERLQIPEYPPLAVQARIEGTIFATVTLNTESELEGFDIRMKSRFEGRERLFMPAVAEAFKKSTFRKDCSGRTVRLVFHLQIHGRPADRPKMSFAFEYPNTFWIISEPRVPSG